MLGRAPQTPVYCAYHGNIPVGGGELIYSNDPYVTGNAHCDDGNHPNGSTSDGVLQGGLTHEHNESITDPEPNSAWTDVATGETTGYEIGDKCAANEGTALGTAPDGAKYNQVINGHFYWYQQEWSNQEHQCLQRLTFSGAEPTATFTSTAGAGTEMTFDATGSTAPGGVARYDWQFNDGEEGLSTPVETTTPTVSHVFPTNEPYVVALTVFAANGTSIGTARTIRVPPAVVTGSASSVTQTAATLNATVNPNGGEVSDMQARIWPDRSLRFERNLHALAGVRDQPGRGVGSDLRTCHEHRLPLQDRRDEPDGDARRLRSPVQHAAQCPDGRNEGRVIGHAHDGHPERDRESQRRGSERMQVRIRHHERVRIHGAMRLAPGLRRKRRSGLRVVGGSESFRQHRLPP